MRRRASGIVAECLRCQPVLTVRAVEITTEHTEGESVRTGKHVEERLLLCRIAGECGDINRLNHQVPCFIETNFTDTAFALVDEAPMTTCEALQGIVWGVLS